MDNPVPVIRVTGSFTAEDVFAWAKSAREIELTPAQMTMIDCWLAGDMIYTPPASGRTFAAVILMMFLSQVNYPEPVLIQVPDKK